MATITSEWPLIKKFFPYMFKTKPNYALFMQIFSHNPNKKLYSEILSNLATLDAVCTFSKWLNPSPLFNIKVFMVAWD